MKAKTTEQFDKAFDEGEDISTFLDVSNARRVNQGQKRVNVDFPLWMVHELDKESSRLGIPRQSLIKTLVARHYDKTAV